MNNYFVLNTEQQRTIITQTAAKVNLPLQAIEKDLWVTTILQILFSLPISKNLVFKGGTSLSKIWGLIRRFSEDIDLAMQEGFSTAPDNVRALGFGAGMGLPNMKRYTDEMYIESEVGKGTKVTIKVLVS